MDKMEKILERLGLYDIWIMIFPGMIFVSGIKTIHDFMLNVMNYGAGAGTSKCILNFNIFYPKNIYEVMAFIVISYLCGHILHELSSWAKCVVYKDGKPTELLLENNNKIIGQWQQQMYMSMFLKLNKNHQFSDDYEERRNESKRIFNLMNAELQLRNEASRYVKLNLIYNMCFTICIDILILLIYIILFIGWAYFKKKCVIVKDVVGIIIVLVSVFGVLYHRSRRYYVYWVRNIISAYENIQTKE